MTLNYLHDERAGATCIEVIRASDSPFSHALTLDPWCEPIKGVDDGGLEIKRPLFVINVSVVCQPRDEVSSPAEMIDD